MVRYQFVSPRYQLDPSNSTKERKNGIFLKSYSLSKKSKGVPLPFLKTLQDSFLCDETNEPGSDTKFVTTQNEPRVAPTLILLCERTNQSKPQSFTNNKTENNAEDLKLINESRLITSKNSNTYYHSQNLEVIITRTSILKFLSLRVSKKLK